MTTETAPELEVAEPTSDQANGSAAPAEEAAATTEPATVPFDDTERVSHEGDPRGQVLDIIRKRLDRVLQPVDDDEVWHGVNVITRKDLNEALALPLPPASSRAASVTTPAMIYVDAICPVCGIASEISLAISPKLTAEGYSRKLELVKDSKALPHVCGQMRIRDVAPSRPVRGQTALDLGVQEIAADSDDGTSSQDDDVDLRPSGEVNPAELQGAARHDVDEAERATDGDDLLPF